MLGCDKTVTLVRYQDEAYVTTTIRGVSWFGKVQTSVQDKGIAAADVGKIRIPADRLPEAFMPRAGDFAVLGEVSGAIEKRSDLDAYQYATVVGVGDNRRGRALAHVVVTCA